MILGIGIDMAEISRFEGEHASKAFLHKVFTPDEIEECLAEKNPAEKLAGKFAVKEAFMKAIGAGIQQEVWFTNIEVLHENSRQPQVNALKKAKQYFDQLGVNQIHVSLSYSSTMAAAVVVLEK
ncbi:holo-ACP synthase [Chloroflexota bacterium]